LEEANHASPFFGINLLKRFSSKSQTFKQKAVKLLLKRTDELKAQEA
jgi:hypothetical protein